ncbi:MAG: PAS domain S-box protein, partial [Candidatus Hodarchaeota archaeon]
TFISPQSIEILGYKPEEALGRNGFDFIHPDDMERAVELFQGTSEEEQVYNFEYRARHKEGYYVPISASGKIIKEKDEYKLISILSDITERKNAEEALIKTKTRLEYLLKSSPAVIYTCEPWGNFQATFMSENVREITGYEVHDFVDHPEFWINGIYPDDRQHAEENFKDIIQKEHYSETYRFKHKDGSYHWMLDEATLIRDEKGNPIETVGYWTDITERKNAEEALKESEEKFRLLFESAPIAIGVSNLEGETIALNQKACEIMGYSADEIIKADLDKTYVNPEIRHKTIQELLSSGEIRDWEVQRIRKNGSKYYVKVNAQIVEEGGQKVILSTMQDITKTKIAEEKIQRSEERYRMLFNESPVSLWELDGSKVKHYIDNLISKGITDLRVYFEIHPEEVDKVIKSVKVLDINTATLKLYRATRKKDLQDLSVIFGEDSLIAFKELILSEGKQAFEIETVNYTLNGERIHVLIRSTIVPGHEESFARMIVSVVDITDRVRMIKALRESEEKFRMLFDESPISIWEEDFSQIRQHINHLKATGVKDIEKYLDEHPEEVKKLAGMIKILDINATSLKMYKAKEKQDFFKGIEVLFREESYLVFKQEIIALFNGHMKFESDQINYTLNGERIHILLKRTIVPGYEESWSRVIVSIVDITDRVEMEKALRESEERLRAFMDSATDSFLLLDSELNIIEVNQNLAIRWNFNKHELIGKNIIDLRERAVFDSPVEYTERFTQLLDVIRTGSLYDEEFTILHPIHGKRYTSVRAFKVGTGLGIISRDITQQKEAELVRRELEQRRENFIYMASHELRTPLTVISGYCDFLDKHDQFIDHDRRDKIISVMKSNVQRLERLTEDVGQVAQIEKEQFQVSKKKFNLCDFLHENLDQYNQLLGNQFTFQRCNTKHSIIITADPDRIQQVLENVISNAIKHTSKDKREINVKVELQDNSVQILISDNGAGIASEHLETIFDQFISFQTEYAAGGTGIGLYLSRRIMEAHGGTITAQSAGKGFGSTFIIELPK